MKIILKYSLKVLLHSQSLRIKHPDNNKKYNKKKFVKNLEFVIISKIAFL